MATGWDNEPIEYSDFVVKVHKDLVQEASLRMLRGVVIRSPVDTGRFRANWQVTRRRTQKIITDFDEGKKKSTIGVVTTKVLKEGREKIENNQKNFPIFYLTNNLPYAQRLENGWSDQAPQGMVKLTLVEVTNWLNRQ